MKPCPASVSPGERPSPCSPGAPSQSCGGHRPGATQPSGAWVSASTRRLGLAGWGFEFCVLRRLCWSASAFCPVTSVSRLQTQLQEWCGASARAVLSPDSCRRARATSCPHDGRSLASLPWARSSSHWLRLPSSGAQEMRTLPPWHSHLSVHDHLDVAGGALVGGRGKALGAGPQATTKNALAGKFLRPRSSSCVRTRQPKSMCGPDDL